MREGLHELLYKNRSWNLKEAFSGGCATCEPLAILGSENSYIDRVTNYLINGKRSCENEANCEKIDVLISEIVVCKIVLRKSNSFEKAEAVLKKWRL